MPNFDKTGPNGKGPATGLGRGRRRGRPCLQPTINSDWDPKEEIYYLKLNDFELEVLRLIDGLKMSQELAADKMGVSRGNIYRYLQSAREKIIKAIMISKNINVEVLK